MKTVILSAQDIEGGAGRSAHRLYRGLLHEQVEAHMIVNLKFGDESTVYGPHSTLGRAFARIRPGVDRLPLALYNKRRGSEFSCQWLPGSSLRRIDQLAPDVVNVHWICDGFVNISSLGHIHRPTVWTLHDMWMFTGGCHYTKECDRYQQHCGACPQLESTNQWDLSRWIWRQKYQILKRVSPWIVTPSDWMADCARQSGLLGHLPVRIIPYGLDLERYRPINKTLARKLLNLPIDKQLLLFGALNPTQDRRKGFHLLMPALQALKTQQNAASVELVMMGTSQQPTLDLGFKVHCLGILKDDVALALAYSAADSFVAPSLQDNLPNTVLEAMACGTPCVAFEIGGMPDLIDHQINGFLASPFEVGRLAEGITWTLDHNSSLDLGHRAREKVEQNFPLGLQAKRYKHLFEEVMGEWTTKQ
jgi:glycosyltransferase involved in cell wall biosynthesis